MTLPASDIHSMLLPGTVQALYQDNKANPLYARPVVQVINIKKLTTGGSGATPLQDRYRLILSDGVAYFQSMLGVQLNDVISRDELALYDIITLTKFTLSTVKERRILIVLEIDTSSITKHDDKIGTPVNIEDLLGTRPLNSLDLMANGPSSTVTAAAAASSIVAEKSFPSLGAAPILVPPTMHTAAPHSRPAAEPLDRPTPSSLSATKAAPTTHQTTLSSLVPSGPIHPISSLSPYQNKWTIKARVTSKSDIKTWTNARGEGKLFSVNLLDETGEIKLTAFNDAANIFYPIFEINKVYTITKGQVKMAKRQFSTVNNDYEIHLDKESLVTWVPDTNASNIPSVRFDFVPIQDIVSYQKDEYIDLIGIVKDIGELGQITTKATQKQMNKRDVTLVDTSMCSIRLTLWGKQAEEANPGLGGDWANDPVLAIKGAKVSDYSGRTLSLLGSSVMTLNPDLKESHELRGWYDTVGSNSSFTNLSMAGSAGDADGTGRSAGAGGNAALEDRKLISQIRDEQLGQNEKADYIDITATVVFIKSDGPISYTACPGGGGAEPACQKKVIEIGPNLYRCEKCQRTYDHADHRYIMTMSISDLTGQTWVNAFNEVAELMIGKPAAEMVDLKESDDALYQKIMKEATFKTWLFRLRVKQEIYQGESKSRSSIISAQPLEYAKESKLLLDHLNRIVVA